MADVADTNKGTADAQDVSTIDLRPTRRAAPESSGPREREIDRSDPMSVSPVGGSLEDLNDADRYDDRRRLGQGGMGEVRLCKDGRIGREVAMKVMLPAHAANDDMRARFLREAQVQGQLEHPAIVPVYDMGKEADGSIFFTMKRLRGMTLAEILEGLHSNQEDIVRSFSRRRLLGAFSAVCMAIDFAHSRGVLHRDLKPANIMLGDFGEVYVLDWGIARLHFAKNHDEAAVQVTPRAEAKETSVDSILGTLGYISPEQARGMHSSLDGRSDVFSLGAILFEILTFERLRPRGERGAMLMSILEDVDARASVRAADKNVPPELEAICVKATRARPEDRFASARELCEAVDRYLDGDRDVELRRQMAASHAEAAEEAATLALGAGGGSEDARRRALREVGRTLALDPTHEGAMRVLRRIITEPPRACPAEVLAAANEATKARALALVVTSIWSELASFAFIIPALIWWGVLDWSIVALAIAVQLCAVLVSFHAWLRRDISLVSQYLSHSLNLLGFLFVARLFGPLVLVPTCLVLMAISQAMASSAAVRVFSLTTTCATLLVTVGLELSGVVSPSYAFRDGSMIILPVAVTLSKVPTLAFLTCISVIAVVAPSMSLWAHRKQLADSEERLLLQAWHLQQLLPDHREDLPRAL